jgi:hypothetical protein
MWPFGKSSISVTAATTAFYDQIAAAFEQEYESILDTFRAAYDDDRPADEAIYMELMPAVWALGIEPVQHIWGENEFKRVRSQMLVRINQSHAPMTEFLVERFLRHTQLLREGIKNGSATYNSDFIIKQLGLPPQPMTSIRLASQLAKLVLPYWKEVDQKYRLF